MSIMESQGLISWTMANPEAGTALATMGLVVVGLLVGLGQIGVILYGIEKLDDGNAAHAARHEKFMETEARRHKKAMDDLAAERTASECRHEQAMDALAAERTASERRHEQAMKALDALIRDTAPKPAPAA